MFINGKYNQNNYSSIFESIDDNDDDSQDFGNDKLINHGQLQMKVCLGFISVYFVVYTIYATHTMIRNRSKMLGPTICIFVSYLIIMILDLTNNIIILTITTPSNIQVTYDEFIIFKMLIRRLSMLILFKVLFTINRVQI